MTKEETSSLQQECIAYVLSLPIDVEWKHSKSVMYWLHSCKDLNSPTDTEKLVPSWEEEDGRDCHIIFRFDVNDSYYNSKNKTELNGLYVVIERYSFRDYDWDRKMGFTITSLEQFKHITKGIIKI